MEKKIEITEHGSKRAIKRMGINKKSVDKNAMEAYEKGLTHSETTGRLNKYLTKEYFTHKNGSELRVYHQYLYVFLGTKLITVFKLPNNLIDLADAQYRKLRGNE